MGNRGREEQEQDLKHLRLAGSIAPETCTKSCSKAATDLGSNAPGAQEEVMAEWWDSALQRTRSFGIASERLNVLRICRAG